MTTLLLTTVLVLGQGDDAATGKAGAAAAGKWLIVYAEEGGRRNNAWEQRQAMLTHGVLSYKGEDEKEKTMKLTFGAHQKVEAVSGTGADAKTCTGVYILGQDYLCISLERGTGQARSSGDFILILRRQRAKTR